MKLDVKGNYDEMVFKRGSHAVSRELRLLVPYGRFMRDDTWVDWKRATGRVCDHNLGQGHLRLRSPGKKGETEKIEIYVELRDMF